MNFSHHPGCGFSGVECAWEDAERPVWRRITLDLSVFIWPHVS
jgi:hypothetical protein